MSYSNEMKCIMHDFMLTSRTYDINYMTGRLEVRTEYCCRDCGLEDVGYSNGHIDHGGGMVGLMMTNDLKRFEGGKG